MNVFRIVADLIDKGESAVLVTIVEGEAGSPGKTGFRMIVASTGKIYGTIGGGAIEHRAIEEAKRLLKERKNLVLPVELKDEGMQCGGRMTLFFDYVEGEKEFVLFGGGHIGRALAPLLTSIGFHVTIFDMRSEIKELIDEARCIDKTKIDVIIGDYEDISPIRDVIRRADYTFIATHGHAYDGVILEQLLKMERDFTYLGLIGSRRKVNTLFKKLRQDGIEIPDFVYAPVGIKIGGDTAEEIAISIAAEVIAVKYKVKANHMRLDSSPGRNRPGENKPEESIPQDNIPRLA